MLTGAALRVSDPVAWLCLGGKGLSWSPLGGHVKSDLSALVWELLQLQVTSSVISEANSGPVHIPSGSCCYGLQNASLGNRRSCNFIPKPGVRLMKQILGFAGHRVGGGVGKGRPQHPRKGWQPMRKGVFIRMRPFQPHSLSEEGDACVRVGFTGRCGVVLVHNPSSLPLLQHNVHPLKTRQHLLTQNVTGIPPFAASSPLVMPVGDCSSPGSIAARFPHGCRA